MYMYIFIFIDLILNIYLCIAGSSFLEYHYLILTQNKGKESEKKLPKIEEISRGKVHTNTQKLIQNILTVTDVFLNQKRVNVCEHMARIFTLF